jgi:hypothetical protein
MKRTRLSEEQILEAPPLHDLIALFEVVNCALYRSTDAPALP